MPIDGSDQSARDRAVGALVGLAVGDAVGTTLEFARPGTFVPITDMTGGGPFGLVAGQWTDDTSMALCLAESLVLKGGFDAMDQLRRYVRWWKEGYLSSTGRCFDIGNQTCSALAQFAATPSPRNGPTGPLNAGNGSLMRLAPVAVAYWSRPVEAIRLAADSSRTTHGNIECVDACRYFAGLLCGAIQGRSREELLGPMFSPVPGLWDTEQLTEKVAAVAAGSFRGKSPPQIRGTGYVVDCLEAALWAFASTEDFRSAVLAAVNLGLDADTTGAVCGQIAGAFYGLSGIPATWRARLAMAERIMELAVALATMGGAVQSPPAEVGFGGA